MFFRGLVAPFLFQIPSNLVNFRRNGHGPVNCAVVEAANQNGHAMGMQTIAEFVENGEILRVLGEIGVNYAQGYGVAKPAPMDEIIVAASQAVQRRSTGT